MKSWLFKLRNACLRLCRNRTIPLFIRQFVLIVGLTLAPICGGADSTNAQIGATVDLAYWDTSVSPDAYTDLGQIRRINGVGVTKAEVDSTTLDSTAMEYIGGLETGDQVTIVFTTGATATHIDRVRSWVTGTSAIEFKLTFNSPATETLYFSLTPLHWGVPTIEPNGLLELEFQGRITEGITATNPHA